MGILQNDKHRPKIQVGAGLEYSCRVVLLLYIITMPFVSAFSFTGTVSLPLIFAVILFLLMGLQVIRKGKLPDGFIGVDIIIISLLLFLAFFSFVTNGFGNSKSFNHTIAYLSSFVLFYITIKFIFFYIKDKDWLLKKVLQFITYATVISAVYANVEFISSNLFDLNLNEYIPRPSEDEKFYEASVVGFLYRARGFAPESGVFTQMMELFLPLTVYYLFFSGFCKWVRWVKRVAITLIIFSIIFAASSATFIILPIAILIASIIYIKKIVSYILNKPVLFYLKTLVVISVGLLINNYLSIYTNILLSVTDKIDSGSFDDRQGRIDFFYEEFSKFTIVNKLIGAGPAGFDILGFESSKSIVSLYYNITIELGLVSLFILFAFMAYIFFYAFSIKNKIGFFIMIAVLSGIMHYYFVHNYWVPWFWFIAAFTIFCSKYFDSQSK